MRKSHKTLLVGVLLACLLAISTGMFVQSSQYSGVKFSQEERKVKIYLDNKRILGDRSDSVGIDGCRVTIYKAGSYQFEGRLEDGQIIVDAGKEDKVTIKLNSVDITCKDSSPIFVKSAGRVKIKLKENSVNYLRDGGKYEEAGKGQIQPKACIYSRDDLTIKGKGTLYVEGNYKHGIYTTDDLRIKGGTLRISALKTGIGAKDSIKISNGDLQIDSQRDGIYCNGKVLISKGQVKITSNRYGIYGREAIVSGPESQITIENAISPEASLGLVTTKEQSTEN